MQNEKNEQKEQILNLLEQSQKFVNEFNYEHFETKIEELKQMIELDEVAIFAYGKNKNFINEFLKEEVLKKNFSYNLKIQNSSEQVLKIKNIEELFPEIKEEFLKKFSLSESFSFKEEYKENIEEKLNLINEALLFAEEKKLASFENIEVELSWPIIEAFSFSVNFRKNIEDLKDYELLLFLAEEDNLKIIKEKIQDKKLKNFLIIADENKEVFSEKLGTKLVFSTKEILKNLQDILNSSEFDAQALKALRDLKDDLEAMKSELLEEEHSYHKNTKEFKKQMESLELNISTLKDTLLEKYNNKNLGFNLIFNILGKSGSLFTFFLRRKLNFKRDIRTINKDIKYIESGINKIKDILKSWDEKNEEKIEDLKRILKYSINVFQFKIRDTIRQLFDDEAKPMKMIFPDKDKIFKKFRASQIEKLFEEKSSLTKREDIQKQIIDEMQKKFSFFFPLLRILDENEALKKEYLKANLPSFDFDAIEFYEKNQAKEFMTKINQIFEDFSSKIFSIYSTFVKENSELYINQFNAHIRMILNGELAFIKSLKDLELKLEDVHFSVDYIYRFSQINMKKQKYLLEKKQVADKAFSKTLNFFNEDWGKETIYDQREKFVVYKENLLRDIEGQFIVITKEIFEDINEYMKELSEHSQEIISFVRDEIDKFLESKEELVKERKKASIDIKARITKANEVKKELENLESSVDKLLAEQDKIDEKLEALLLPEEIIEEQGEESPKLLEDTEEEKLKLPEEQKQDENIEVKKLEYQKSEEEK